MLLRVILGIPAYSSSWSILTMDTLLDRLRKNNPDDNARANRHAVAFLAHKEEIIAALNDGWSARKIWEQMTKDKTVSMCYVSFCRHVNKTIRPRAGGKGHTVGITPVAPKPRKKSSEAQAAPEASQTPNPPVAQSEQERLEQLREEAFAAVRSKKPAGPLITRPKTREEEHRELFGD